MSSQQAFPVISDTHIIDNKLIFDAIHKVFSEELPYLLNDNEISFVHSMIKQTASMINQGFSRTLYSN